MRNLGTKRFKAPLIRSDWDSRECIHVERAPLIIMAGTLTPSPPSSMCPVKTVASCKSHTRHYTTDSDSALVTLKNNQKHQFSFSLLTFSFSASLVSSETTGEATEHYTKFYHTCR